MFVYSCILYCAMYTQQTENVENPSDTTLIKYLIYRFNTVIIELILSQLENCLRIIHNTYTDVIILKIITFKHINGLF